MGVGWNKAHNHYHQYIVSRLALHHDTARWFCFDLGDNWDVKTVVHLHTNKTYKTYLSYLIHKMNCDHCIFYELLILCFWQPFKSGQCVVVSEIRKLYASIHTQDLVKTNLEICCDCQNNYIVPHSLLHFWAGFDISVIQCNLKPIFQMFCFIYKCSIWMWHMSN